MAEKKTTKTAKTASLQELQKENDLQVRNLQEAQLQLADAYKKEDKVEVTISPMYKPYFGNNMPVIINGVSVYVPVNGRAYKIPKSFAMEVRGRIRAVDDQINRQKRLADVANNHERYIGEKDLISPVR